MQELKTISYPSTPDAAEETPPWNRIYKFALAAWIFGMLSLAMAAAGFLSGCGGGGSGGGSSGGGTDNVVVNSLSQYVLPGEISAVPASKEENLQTTSVTSKKTVMVSKLGYSSFSNMAKAFGDANTDYTKAIAHKFVEEPALEQFSILEEVMTALNQTKYYEQIGQPAYKAMVTMVGGGEGGKEQKSLEPWVVESDIIDANGNVIEPQNAVEGRNYDVRVRAWIEEEGRIIKGQFIISDPPNQDSDGAYLDYGNWTLDVSFTDSGDEFFAASCSVNTEGQSVIRLNETMGPEGPGSGDNMGLTEVRAIMYRSEDEGYGKVEFPDWDAIHGPDADPNLTEIPTISAKYAYNENYLALKEEDEETIYKDRTEIIEMTHRYGVFRYDNGDDIMKSNQFGFPFYYDDDQSGFRRYGYYGAWQGRHQIWMDMDESQGNMSSLEGLEITREDHGSDAVKQTYSIGKTFNGTLVIRDYIPASLEDIKNIPVEIWVNKDYQLLWDAGAEAWDLCKDINWSGPSPTCNSTPVDFGTKIGFESLVVGENDDRKHVNINGWDDDAATNKEYVYLLENTIGTHLAGFYEAEQNMATHRYEAKEPLVAINTQIVTNLWIWMGGSLWVEYTGTGNTGWVEKEVVGFDETAWMPEFGNSSKDYILPSNNELYINMQGASYVVRKDINDTVKVQLELQTTLNPENAATLMPTGTVLKDPWDTDNFNSTYKFITDPLDPKYLMLVYASIGVNDQDQNGNSDLEVGDLVTNGMWGIEDIDGNAFNWEYSSNGGWGSITYLMDGDQYILLDDPVRFQPLEITHNGTPKTLGLQYDGWMNGLPDLYWELERNDWQITEDISNKIINLKAGTRLTSVEGYEYVLKPLEISQFLKPATGVETSLLPNITLADSVDLSTVPDFTPHGMGTMPADTVVEYSEGLPVN